MNNSSYDIIGDVHGCAQTLERLLDKLDYKKERFDGDKKAYWHPSRKAIFVGDVIDRGPRIREALHIIKNMSDAGTAICVMGNHEFHAMAYTTRAPEGSDREYVREHTPRHNRLIKETLLQFAPYMDEWQMFLSWFKTLPVFLNYPSFRVVHACWDQNLIDAYIDKYRTNTVSEEVIRSAWDHGAFTARFLDRLTRGTTLLLPEGRKISGRDGYVRRTFRTKFWCSRPETYEDIVFQPDPLPGDLLKRKISDEERQQLLNYGENEVPVFIGHYWLQGTPIPLRPNVACLDYSAVKYGRLVAYRFDGEPRLDPKKFEWVYVDP